MGGPAQKDNWIAEAKSGDRFALAKLLASCDPCLRARAKARMDAALQARSDPDDILQEVYMEIVRRIRQFEGGDLRAFLGWARLILDHKIIDVRRAAHGQRRDIHREIRATHYHAKSYWNLLDQVYAESGTPSRIIRRQEALGALLDSLPELSTSHRQIIEWRFLEGLTVAESAARLHKSEEAVVSLTQRACRALRQCMDRLGEFTHGA